ncbi:hypothetical protein LOAG_04616 [Loa loa]|uniref:Uncharacterized protein n=1 Tax=Loa loa TaxID=7209 RepID=A0A1I7VM35_LOALO|nr:hypothetical protein LOAG_04616 [Loa loa]EFO23872.2 hypothetical protein LOAG_04616 [Loa loa]
MEVNSRIITFYVFWTIDFWVATASGVENILKEEQLNNGTIISSSNLIFHLLNNLSSTESAVLDRYLCEKNYASLKIMIDRKRAELFQIKDKPLKSFVDIPQRVPENFGADIVEVFLNATVPLNFTQEQFKYAEAYRNATIYSIIRALWNTKVEQDLPQIDQYAILEYYNEKRAQKKAEENILIWLWNIIRKLFDGKNDKFECYANEPKCVRAVLDRCGATELEHLQQATDNEPMLINDFIKNKLDDDLEMYMEYDKWNNANDVPGALKEIIHSLTQAQKRAMEKLRRLELTDKIKDFYRENIEKTSLPKQQEIELFFRRMNTTFAGCYNPNIKKAKERYES